MINHQRITVFIHHLTVAKPCFELGRIGQQLARLVVLLAITTILQRRENIIIGHFRNVEAALAQQRRQISQFLIWTLAIDKQIAPSHGLGNGLKGQCGFINHRAIGLGIGTAQKIWEIPCLDHGAANVIQPTALAVKVHGTAQCWLAFALGNGGAGFGNHVARHVQRLDVTTPITNAAQRPHKIQNTWTAWRQRLIAIGSQRVEHDVHLVAAT